MSNSISAISHAGVKKCLRFIVVNISEPIQISDLERISGLSRRGLHKAFQKHTGFGPGRVLRQMRIQHAKRVLEENDLPLDQIAELCGFRSVNSFWVAFRRSVGMSPKRYQRRTWVAAYRQLRAKRERNGLLALPQYGG
jgi:LacI family transcriptional regulator